MEPIQNNNLPELNSLKQDVVPPEGLLERSEKKLFERISQADSAEPWELYLKKDAEKAEVGITAEAVVARAGKKAFAVSLPLLFSSFSLSIARSRIVQAALLVAVISAAGLISWNYIAKQYSSLQTVAVYSEHGVAQRGQRFVRESETVATGPGQRAVLSNNHGTVVVENGGSVTIQKARQNRMDYTVAFSTFSPDSSAQVIFSVSKKKADREFSASTRDYVVHVVGTVFKVTPQIQGRTAIKVLEGAVRIEGAGIFALVSAGNTFAFNDQAGTYMAGTFDTGRAVTNHFQSMSDTTSVQQKAERQFRHMKKTARPVRDSLLELAVRFEASDWKKAIATYNAVVSRPGGSPYSREIALFSIGRLQADHDAPASDVRAAFNAYLKSFPQGSFTGESYLRLADLEYKTNPGQALVWYEKYLQEFPATQNTAAAEYKAGLIYLEQKKHGKAAELLSSALRHAKNYPPDQVAAIQRVLDNAKNPRSDSSRNNLGK
jgi:outer membrane protein assembly factor BamD (BamD/ComL family)